MSETIDPKVELKQARQRVATPMLWIAQVSIMMLFAGLTSAYIVTKADNFWVDFDLPEMFYYSTALILLSSLPISLAIKSVKKNNYNGVKTGLLATLFLGLCFVYCQYSGWGQLVQSGNFVVGNIDAVKGTYGTDYTINYNGSNLLFSEGRYYMPNDIDFKEPISDSMFQSFNSASSFLYILSGMHLAHLLGGLLALFVTFYQANRNKYNANNYTGLKICVTYWHFLGALWLYLFCFLFFINQ
jgi:cytochrome c oxidase subunit 3